MKLLELINELNTFKRLKREKWGDRFIVRKIGLSHHHIAKCDLHSMIIENWLPRIEDLSCDDWSIVE